MYFWTPARHLPAGAGGVAIFSAAHLAWLSCALLFAAGACAAYRRAGTRVRRRLLLAASSVMVLSELGRMGLLLLSGGFSAADSLPLHLCGVMVFAEWHAAVSRNRFCQELSWSLGLPGALCALVTPGETGYPFWNIYYLQFILVHTLLLLVPLLLALDGFRPRARRLPACFCFLLALALLDAGVNALYGGNYLFLSAPPPGSLLEAVRRLSGAWYLPAAAGMVWLIWGLCWGTAALFQRVRIRKPAVSRQ